MMRVLFFFIFSLISVSYVQSDLSPCVICAYQGANQHGKFKLEDVPERCEAVLYGGNYFNAEPPQEDTAAITGLKKAGKPVYMLYIYEKGYAGQNLFQITFPNHTQKLDQHMAPMISYLKKNEIDGVLLGYLSFLGNDIPCYDVKINEFVCKIKKLVPSIKVGLFLPGFESDQWKKKDLFDFTVTNDNVDFYMIDSTTAGNSCNKNTRANGGLTPLTSTDPTVASLTEMCTGTSGSGMDQSKVMINVVDSAFQADSSTQSMKTVSEYCLRNPKEIWCIDSIDLIYKQVELFKKTFKGMMISSLDTDDMDNSCKCGKYPLANTYIDAWQKKTIKCCDAIV